jgi:Alcohol dehydrogenase GroES-like domain
MNVDSMYLLVYVFTSSTGIIPKKLSSISITKSGRIGEENLCDKPRSLGIYNDGGYAEYVLVPSYKYLVKIGDDMDRDTSAPLGCAGLIWCGKKCRSKGISPCRCDKALVNPIDQPTIIAIATVIQRIWSCSLCKSCWSTVFGESPHYSLNFIWAIAFPNQLR